MGRRAKNDRPPRSGDRAAARPQNRLLVLAVCGFLLMAVGLVFGQTLRHGFVNIDDNAYVCENPQIYNGFTARGIGWVFTHSHGSNWHPLTGMSHMLDCQLYDLKPWGHHLTSVVLHGATVVLLFLVLLRMTGGLWPIAFAAAALLTLPPRRERLLISTAFFVSQIRCLSHIIYAVTLSLADGLQTTGAPAEVIAAGSFRWCFELPLGGAAGGDGVDR